MSDGNSVPSRHLNTVCCEFFGHLNGITGLKEFSKLPKENIIYYKSDFYNYDIHPYLKAKQICLLSNPGSAENLTNGLIGKCCSRERQISKLYHVPSTQSGM